MGGRRPRPLRLTFVSADLAAPAEGVLVRTVVAPGLGIEVHLDLSGLGADGGQLALELDQ
ncbi:hypothetical protein GCM10009629_57990 [Pseudonocardia alni]